MGTENRGFAGMKNKQRQREIATRGGIAAHKKGKAHEWDKESAKVAGRRGGLARAKKAVEQIPDDITIKP